MSFDEQPDGDIHGECSAEIHRLEQQNAELVAALKAWDALIQYNYSGSREAMSAMQQCAFDTKDILDTIRHLNMMEEQARNLETGSRVC